MRIVCQQTILMKYHALFVSLEKGANLKLSSAANYRWRFGLREVETELIRILQGLQITPNTFDPYHERYIFVWCDQQRCRLAAQTAPSYQRLCYSLCKW